MGTLEFKPIKLIDLINCFKTRLYFTSFTAFSKTKSTINRKFGGGKRDRTADLLHAMQALSQLSYTPVYNCIWVLKLATIQEGAILMTSAPIVNEILRKGLLISAYYFAIQIAINLLLQVAASLLGGVLQPRW